MMPNMKWLLLMLLSWLLLFLSLLCHILDPRSAAEAGLTRAKTLHMLSVLNRRMLKPTGVSETELRERTDYRSRSEEILQRLWSGNLTAAMLSPRLQKELKLQLRSLRHHVAPRGPSGQRRSALQLSCDLKRSARVQTVDGTEEPFLSLGWASLVPSKGLQASEFQRCAVVMSSAAVLNSGLGAEIDSHDAVLRFNAAPTSGFERDVGSKTTIRIINSQIVARPEHAFNHSSLYRNVTLLVWDPARYSANLSEWFKQPDFDLFSGYVERRLRHPEQPFYILHPKFLWGLWDRIQDNTEERIQPNPPSSGFTGIVLMMSLCHEVSVYEFLPSVRRTDRCHYYEYYQDAACTLGAYHPLLYEKLLIQRINVGGRDQLTAKGKVTLSGFRTLRCPTPSEFKG
ncbi:beta-galactoside alpha-2,6-sialyltransferase 2-like isoform X2 [Sander lucioperca]|uniref:beta-galactoside alpha-2,6-sialyltransferase 2-like isoform X2 n=1 Tax=Sander lucioperca TaxID=283035 RepID=UPI00125D8F54|nr:beta-galactoside alpha-2,6-sialyltransferase 2-like isoform X2 [Sander lucioperca]